MTASSAGEAALGLSPDVLSIAQRRALAGRWIALPVYDPHTLPLRLIQAIGSSPEECALALRSRGLDPALFEYSVLQLAY
ncbi:MAG: hypothetical protein NTZ56_11785 [Acidobacteria bacterium]|nr:hypothetical protein [Acidobacteriota bacterium]